VSNLSIACDVFGGGASPSTPQTILGSALLAWYRADLGITLNGSNVSAWADQSGTGDANKNAIQNTGAHQPAFNASNASYNNSPTVTFTSSQDLTTGTWASSLVAPYTIFVAGHTNDGTRSNCHVGSNAGVMTIYSAASSDVEAYSDSGSHTLLSGVSDIGTPSVAYFQANGVSSRLGVRQITPNTTATDGTAGTVTEITLGNLQGLSTIGLGGPLAEVVIATGAISSALIGQVMLYMGARYAISIGA
jgi:hypothetical protein